jgi:hypothetical protein
VSVAILDAERRVMERQATDAKGWLRLLSQEYGKPAAELRRLFDRHDLAEEIAGLIVRHAKRVAFQNIQDGTEPDSGEDLINRTTWRVYRHHKAEKDAKENEIARRRLEALHLAQQIEERRAARAVRAAGQAPDGQPQQSTEADTARRG